MLSLSEEASAKKDAKCLASPSSCSAGSGLALRHFGQHHETDRKK